MTAPSVVAVIPAKGSSVRIAGKNLRHLAGVPLFVWTVRAARAVMPRMAVVVSTDEGSPGDEIARTALHEGAIVVRRSTALCHDPAQMPEVVQHALSTLGITTGSVVVLLPTSPFRTAQHIQEALALHSGGANVVSVSDATALHHKLCITTHDGLRIAHGPPLREAFVDCQRAVTLNGAIWIAPVQRFLEDGHVSATNAIPYVMSSDDGLDIDTPLDFHLAEVVAANRPHIPAQ